MDVQTQEFAESGNVMHREMRALNLRKVNENMAAGMPFRSDQGEIWDKVAELACDMKVVSSTGAMRDVYEARGPTSTGISRAPGWPKARRSSRFATRSIAPNTTPTRISRSTRSATACSAPIVGAT